jgi:hypothetical protein
MKDTVIIAGSLAQKPGFGGHTWVFLQYVLGFKKLGWDVVFIDHLQPEMCVDRQGQRCSLHQSVNLDYFVRVMTEFGLVDSYALLYDKGQCVIGIPRAKLLEISAQAAVLINVMGFVRDDEILSRAQKLVFLDIDPGFGQMWQELGLCTMFNGHDCYVTIGENIGQHGCTIPTCGLNWITSRQPIQLDYWAPTTQIPQRGFTTVASWRGPYGPIDFQGKTYGLRVHEFRKVAVLPKSTGERFEIALDIHTKDDTDKVLLQKNGWILSEPAAVSGDPWCYRRFIGDSAAEFMVAKNIYVETGSGWFSDRSTCYLASGKPVLAQDTGLKSLYPIGEGLLTFTSLDEAISGVEEICRNYPAHARAARTIAEEYFDSDKVLKALLDKVF